MKKKCFTATSTDGAKYTWKFWREETIWDNHGISNRYWCWFLEDHKGHIRALEETWRDSAPRINAILANYDMTARIS